MTNQETGRETDQQTSRDRLIAFLEREAQVLRRRIDNLKGGALPELGITTGSDAETPEEQEIREHEARLAELEGHLEDLRKEAGVTAAA